MRSLNHLVGAEQQPLRDRDAERLRGFHVDRQLELCRPLDGKVRGLGTLENPIHVTGDSALEVANVRAIGQ